MVFWSGLENGVGIICGCLPACRSLVAHLFPRLNMITRPSEGASSETYGSHSRPRIKPDAKQVDSSTRTFVELESYPENSEEMETGPTDSEELETGPTDRASAHSQDSETPIHV